MNRREKIASRLRWNPGGIKQNAHLVMLACYVAVLVANYLRYGALFQFSLGLYCLLSLPVVVILGNVKGFVRSWVPFILLLLSYEALQGVVGGLTSSNSVSSLYPLDKLFWGFNLTGAIQSTLNTPLLTAVTTILYSLHFPLITALSIFLWYHDRIFYRRYVSALVITSYICLLIFLLMPTAPPWYSGQAQDLLGDVSGQFSSVFSGIAQITTLVESNRFAAFPSLHAAYASLFCYYMVRSARRSWVFAVPVTAGILFSTLYLGQHYLTDLISGAGLALSVAVAVELAGRRTAGTRVPGRGGPGIVSSRGESSRPRAMRGAATAVPSAFDGANS